MTYCQERVLLLAEMKMTPLNGTGSSCGFLDGTDESTNASGMLPPCPSRESMLDLRCVSVKAQPCVACSIEGNDRCSMTSNFNAVWASLFGRPFIVRRALGNDGHARRAYI